MSSPWFPLAICLMAMLAGRAQDSPTVRRTPITIPPGGRAGFTLLTSPQTGVVFTNYLHPDQTLTNSVLNNGSGVALGDVDGDGLADIYFSAIEGTNRLFRNLGGWRFADITQAAGVGCVGQHSTGVALADLDGDGDLDLLVNAIGNGTRLFLNDGHARFKEATIAAGLDSRTAAMSFALADVDGDGDLDFYVCNFRIRVLTDEPDLRFSGRVTNGVPTITAINGQRPDLPEWAGRFSMTADGRPLEWGEPDLLWLNNGAGRFTVAPWTNGLFLDEEGRALREPPRDFGLSAMFRDFNGDGWTDLYVCNDSHTPDRLWLGDGRGHFRAAPPTMLRHFSLSSMGVDVADLNRDGHDDFIVLDMLSRHHSKRLSEQTFVNRVILHPGEIENRPQYPRNTLFLARGDGTFAEIAEAAGLEASEWSWTPVFLDVDLDGYEDLLVSNGFMLDVRNADARARIDAVKAGRRLSTREEQKLRKLYPGYETPSLGFRNRGDLTFEEMGTAWGFNHPGVAHGMAVADLDNDGDLDVVMNNFNAEASLYRNESPAPRLLVKLKGAGANTRGIGARIVVEPLVHGQARPVQSQVISLGGRFLSSDDAVRMFAGYETLASFKITIQWPDGTTSVITNGLANHLYEISEETKAPAKSPSRIPSVLTNSLFRDVSSLLPHAHHEVEFDDFNRQPLLPHKLSQLGPGVTWADLDGDGWDELLIATGRGGTPGIFKNMSGTNFIRFSPAPSSSSIGDLTSLLVRPHPGGAEILAGFSGYESPGKPPAVWRWTLQSGKLEINEAVPLLPASTGPLALADIDGDGDLDLFIGGRFIPKRWPEPASSLIYRNQDGVLIRDESNAAVLAEVGMVSGAVFTDLDQDGFPELAIACEWGAIKVFRNSQGKFGLWDLPVDGEKVGEKAERLGLSKFTGQWTSITAGDFDGDGRLDLVAGSWGRNLPSPPRRIVYGDFNTDGLVEIIESYQDDETGQLVPARNLGSMLRGMPWLAERFMTYQQFATASVAEILGDRVSLARELVATTTASMLFLNRGDHFEARELPYQAQIAPAFGLCVADFDGDTHEDLVLAQNFFAVEPERARLDAGRGLLLRGDGRGGFAAVAGPESGLLIYGEQRGAAVCDFDGDGRPDLAVAQNAASTKLYQNRGGKPGLRVRLAGGPGNPAGLGAVMRVGRDGKFGAARELHGGAGFWSQDSAVTVFGFSEAREIQVRWPGGKETVSRIPINAKEIAIRLDGTVSAK